MDNKSLIIIAVITIVVAVVAIAIYYYKKRNLTKLFEQIYVSARQIPKQKKKSFLLLMFMETMSASLKKSKTTPNMNKLNNPKYLEIQLVKMSKILKDSSDIKNVKNKKTKQSLRLLNDYLKWEDTNRNIAS
ncbi:hypothetical protein [Helicovermis profundi]|uniref:Uncharacterized protein n=1 Tax=Helicovermis profundi TaxID=3065157 RepID=A0AAU9E3M9_9FIRM|nr:hypothetical protein HLPR_08610 [Clostridia bacterium S502]